MSFNGNKIITTSTGGALICQDEHIKNRTIFLATQAKDKVEFYEHSEIGYNYRMSNILAGIGIGQMKVLEEYIKKKERIMSSIKLFLKKLKVCMFYKNHPMIIVLTIG